MDFLDESISRIRVSGLIIYYFLNKNFPFFFYKRKIRVCRIRLCPLYETLGMIGFSMQTWIYLLVYPRTTVL